MAQHAHSRLAFTYLLLVGTSFVAPIIASDVKKKNKGSWLARATSSGSLRGSSSYDGTTSGDGRGKSRPGLANLFGRADSPKNPRSEVQRRSSSTSEDVAALPPFERAILNNDLQGMLNEYRKAKKGALAALDSIIRGLDHHFDKLSPLLQQACSTGDEEAVRLILSSPRLKKEEHCNPYWIAFNEGHFHLLGALLVHYSCRSTEDYMRDRRYCLHKLSERAQEEQLEGTLLLQLKTLSSKSDSELEEWLSKDQKLYSSLQQLSKDVKIKKLNRVIYLLLLDVMDGFARDIGSFQDAQSQENIVFAAIRGYKKIAQQEREISDAGKSISSLTQKKNAALKSFIFLCKFIDFQMTKDSQRQAAKEKITFHPLFVQPNKEGDFPLHAAVATLEPELVKHLLGRQDQDNHMFFKLRQELIAHPTTYVNKHTGNTPLHIAADTRSPTIFAMLLNAQLPVEHRNNQGRTAWNNSQDTDLHRYASAGRAQEIKKADTIKENINRKNPQGNTPLHLAVAHEHGEACKTLLTLHADPKIANNEGNTPLHTAVQEKKYTIVRIIGTHFGQKTFAELLQIPDADKVTPMQLALENSDPIMVALLQKLAPSYAHSKAESEEQAVRSIALQNVYAKVYEDLKQQNPQTAQAPKRLSVHQTVAHIRHSMRRITQRYTLRGPMLFDQSSTEATQYSIEEQDLDVGKLDLDATLSGEKTKDGAGHPASRKAAPHTIHTMENQKLDLGELDPDATRSWETTRYAMENPDLNLGELDLDATLSRETTQHGAGHPASRTAAPLTMDDQALDLGELDPDATLSWGETQFTVGSSATRKATQYSNAYPDLDATENQHTQGLGVHDLDPGATHNMEATQYNAENPTDREVTHYTFEAPVHLQPVPAKVARKTAEELDADFSELGATNKYGETLYFEAVASLDSDAIKKILVAQNQLIQDMLTFIACEIEEAMSPLLSKEAIRDICKQAAHALQNNSILLCAISSTSVNGITPLNVVQDLFALNKMAGRKAGCQAAADVYALLLADVTRGSHFAHYLLQPEFETELERMAQTKELTTQLPKIWHTITAQEIEDAKLQDSALKSMLAACDSISVNTEPPIHLGAPKENTTPAIKNLDSDNNNLLQLAIRHGCFPAILERIVRLHRELYSLRNAHGETALHFAASKLNPKTVELVLQAAPDQKAQITLQSCKNTERRRTALFEALALSLESSDTSNTSSLETCRKLLEHGGFLAAIQPSGEKRQSKPYAYDQELPLLLVLKNFAYNADDVINGKDATSMVAVFYHALKAALQVPKPTEYHQKLLSCLSPIMKRLRKEGKVQGLQLLMNLLLAVLNTSQYNADDVLDGKDATSMAAASYSALKATLEVSEPKEHQQIALSYLEPAIQHLQAIGNVEGLRLLVSLRNGPEKPRR